MAEKVRWPIVSRTLYARSFARRVWPADVYEQVARRYVVEKAVRIALVIVALPAALPIFLLKMIGLLAEWLDDNLVRLVRPATNVVDRYANRTQAIRQQAAAKYGFQTREEA